MQPADYRLVRSRIDLGIMRPIKRNVFPKTIDHYFSYWLYGQNKSTEEISVNLSRSTPCLVCSNENIKSEEFSLLNIDLDLFLRCLPLLNNQQLSILYSLLEDDQQLYLFIIQQQYLNYKQRLIENFKRK